MKEASEKEERTSRVIRAALAMQRWPWEQGVLAQALLDWGDAELAVLMAHEAVVNQYKDGRLGMKYDRGAATDPASNGEPVLFAASATGDAKYKAAAQRMLEYLLYRAPRTRDRVLFHNENQGQIWVDAFFMSPPFLAVAGEHEEAVRQVEGMRRYLWDPAMRLFHHQWDDDRKEFSRAAFWGVGNGWAATGMTRVLGSLPVTMRSERERIAGYVGETLEGCLAHQRMDSLFHDVVDDPSTFVETNLAQMLAYAIYRGVAGGWLNRTYLSRADAMRERVYEMVDERGLVQGVCAAPTFDYPGTAPEGQAFFLFMEAAHRDALSKDSVSRSTAAPGS